MSERPSVFERIVAGDLPSRRLYEDDRVVCILDINPMSRGHSLIFPRRHAFGLTDLDPEDGRRMFELAQRLSGFLKKALPECAAVNLFLADGKAAGQEVPHVHLHVTPRDVGDGIRLRGPSRVRRLDAELEQDTTLIRAALAEN